MTAEPPTFDAVYRETFPFVWRTVGRLGVHPSALDDVVQEVFVTVYKRLPTFEGRSTVKTWVFGVARRVVADHRRRSSVHSDLVPHLPDEVPDAESLLPDAVAARRQAVALFDAVLGELDASKREVFVLAEIEEMTAAEIGEVLGESPNTVSSRLRAARREFEAALARHAARDTWRLR